jgi:hypothetical protein
MPSAPQPAQPDEKPPRTPLVKRLPTTVVLVVAFVLARLAGHTLWLSLLIFLAANVVGILILHLVFRQPLRRLLRYEEPADN